MKLDGGEYSSSSAECLNSLSKKNKKSKNKKRFSDEQIKSLETMFESESKLEPRQKLQLARELGLQPRQVAIWFQNKRARWKSKELERDYNILRANYNTLNSQFEALKKEKEGLIIQLHKLNDMMQNSQEEKQCCSRQQEAAENSIGDQLDGAANTKSEFAAKPGLSPEISGHRIGVLSDEDSSIKEEYFCLDEEPEFLNMVEPTDSSLTSPENWGSLDSGGLLDQSGSSCQWWDFWS